ncbi:hypothetical protein AA0119_g9384 [Alternaria tenuissima]|uniref:Heterokaryon incompatibility domain-containing protein n=1 Tax=Alternaria tenuissima TaxID=119927 RepID=A0AB37W7E2_9PLEO|nr:hypothetical protein AA0115_g9747 [Alternaria tenuissima]RYN94131.1 hypothetical protein AA0119_g9384 [Alternaria tenuissima]RYO10747.1 hypothetical protein AA0121_g10536 [Alternaria tenuissima]
MQNPYRHIPLEGSRSIRVLELQPAPNAIAPIICKLRPLSLDDYPQCDANYTALSYTWDGQTLIREIECDGHVMLITPNYDAAIRSLRSETGIWVLWIDSICIDQSEEGEVERNGQVALMGEIYKSAAEVVVWLGQSNERVEAAIQKIMELAHIAETGGVGDGIAINYENRRATQKAIRERIERISSSKLPLIPKIYLPIDINTGATQASDDPFGPLFECSWFYRVWTIQECTLPFFERMTLRCGILEVSWAAVFMIADLLKAAKYRWGRYEAAMALQTRLVTYLIAQRIEGARAVLNQNPGKLQNDPLMFSILEDIRMKQATNPKDKIIGMYGLLKELDIPFPIPNYSLSVEEIFREATRASIEYDQKLHLLYQAPSDRRREGLASWVPDWGELGFHPSDMRYAALGGRFTASGPGTSLWGFSEDHKELILQGKIVDTVVQKFEALPDTRSLIFRRENTPAEMSRLNHAASTSMKSWVEVSRRTDYPTGELSKEALQRTLVYDQPESNAEAVRDNAFNDWYNKMCSEDMDQVARRSRDIAFSRTQATDSDTDLIERLFGTNRFHLFAHMFSSKKCFFSTAKNYFGTAPDPLPVSMMEGDKIAIISGLEMPLLLRPVGDKYRLITHVYVHGIMYGEMWSAIESCLDDIILL